MIEVLNEIRKFAEYARASSDSKITIGAGTLEFWADKLTNLQPPKAAKMEVKQNCEECLYTGKVCPECLPRRRVDTEGRDVTELPGLWDKSDVEL